MHCFDSFEAAAHLRDGINALNRVASRPDPFSTFEFLQNYFRHDERDNDGNSPRLWLLTAFDGSGLLGYLPLKLVVRHILWMRTPTLGFLVSDGNDRPHVVATPENLPQVTQAFWDYLFRRGWDWTLFELQQQDEASSLWPPPGTLDLSRYWMRTWPNLENSTIQVRWETLSEYFAALSKKFRSNLRRNMRGLFTAGHVSLLASSDPATTPALVELFRSIEANSWKLQARVNTGSHPGKVRRYKGLLDPAQPMQISLQILMLDELPIAGLITGAFMKGLYALDIVYDRRLSHLAPGTMMLMMGMHQAIKGRYESFNLLSGSAYYKVRWLAFVTRTQMAQVYRVGRLPFWSRLVGDAIRWTRSAALDGKSVRFNPSRQEVDEREGAKPTGVAAVGISVAERARIDALIAAARKGKIETLSSTSLASLMPFLTLRAPPATADRDLRSSREDERLAGVAYRKNRDSQHADQFPDQQAGQRAGNAEPNHRAVSGGKRHNGAGQREKGQSTEAALRSEQKHQLVADHHRKEDATP